MTRRERAPIPTRHSRQRTPRGKTPVVSTNHELSKARWCLGHLGAGTTRPAVIASAFFIDLSNSSIWIVNIFNLFIILTRCIVSVFLLSLGCWKHQNLDDWSWHVGYPFNVSCRSTVIGTYLHAWILQLQLQQYHAWIHHNVRLTTTLWSEIGSFSDTHAAMTSNGCSRYHVKQRTIRHTAALSGIWLSLLNADTFPPRVQTN